MLINADYLEDEVLQTEYCIIGSGIGGGTLAHELAAVKKKFYVIEAGDLKGNSKTVQLENTGLPFGLSTTTSVELGGTSNLWHGVLGMLDPVDFVKRDWIPYSGWPITLNDLLPFYQRASALFHIRSYEYFFTNGLSESLKAKLSDISFNRAVVENKLFQQPLPPLRFKSVVKSITHQSSVHNCVYNAVALELKLNDDGGVKELLIKNKKGRTIFIRAEKFILAAGALQTPRILLNSPGFRGGEKFNTHALIGKFLMDHPMGNLCQLEFRKEQKAHIYSDMKYASDNKIKSGLTFKEGTQKDFNLPNHNFYLRPSFVEGINNESEKIKLALLTFLDRDKKVTMKEVVKIIKNFNVLMQIVAYKFSLNVTFKFADLFFVTEQIPNKRSNVSLSTKADQFGYPIARVNWELTEADHESLRKAYKILRSSVFSEKNFRYVHDYADLDWEHIFTSGAHHVGTARMAANASEGVTDKNLKIFGCRNLYIADGSVFPTAGNVNSGFTISALASRLVHHLTSN